MGSLGEVKLIVNQLWNVLFQAISAQEFLYAKHLSATKPDNGTSEKADISVRFYVYLENKFLNFYRVLRILTLC